MLDFTLYLARIQNIFKLGQVQRVELFIQSYFPVIFYVLLQKIVPKTGKICMQRLLLCKIDQI